MTLPSTYPINQWQIEDEFGLPRGSAFPAAFYGKGGAPSSGTLSFGDFLGRSNGPTYTPGDGYYDSYSMDYASYTIYASQNVVWYWDKTGMWGDASVANGGTASSITFSLWNGNPNNPVACTFQVSSNGHSWTIHLNAGNGIGTNN